MCLFQLTYTVQMNSLFSAETSLTSTCSDQDRPVQTHLDHVKIGAQSSARSETFGLNLVLCCLHTGQAFLIESLTTLTMFEKIRQISR